MPIATIICAIFILCVTAQPAQAGWRDWFGFLKPFVTVPEKSSTVGAEEVAPTQQVPPTDRVAPLPISATPSESIPVITNQPAVNPIPTNLQQPQNEMQCSPGEFPGVNEKGQKSCIRKNPNTIPSTSSGGQSPKLQPINDNANNNDDDDGEESDQPRMMIDPQQIKQVAQEIKKQQTDLKRLLTQAKKLTGSEAIVTTIQTLIAKLTEFQTDLKTAKGDDLITVMEDYRDAQIWDEVNMVRAQVELPKRLTDINRDLGRVEKLLKTAAIKKLTDFGISLDIITKDVATMRTTADQVKTLLAAGSYQDAQDTLHDTFNDTNPGDIQNILNRIRDMYTMVHKIRNEEIKQDILGILAPIFESINNSEYRDANDMMNDVQRELQPLFNQLYKLTTAPNSKLQSKLDTFKAKMEDKLLQQKPTDTNTTNQ